MSYILDALVRADLERRRRSVPGIHTVQVPPAGGEGRSARPVWAGAVVLAALLLLAWDRLGPTVVRGPAGPGTETPAPAGAAAPAADEAAKAAAAPPAGKAAGPARAADRPRGAAGSALKLDGEIRPRPGRIYAIAELPPDLREDARKVKVTGFALAGGADERLAIINDRALREGDEVTTGLRVERISGDGVVFNLKGFRFRKGGAGS